MSTVVGPSQFVLSCCASLEAVGGTFLTVRAPYYVLLGPFLLVRLSYSVLFGFFGSKVCVLLSNSAASFYQVLSALLMSLFLVCIVVLFGADIIGYETILVGNSNHSLSGESFRLLVYRVKATVESSNILSCKA